jgi:ABC-type cobalt transport system substrate-binding protein
MSLQEQQVELKVQKGIRQAEDDLVLWIQAALDTTKYGNLEESQFRNLVRVADTTDSAEVIKNFIRYQVGRDKKWGRGKGSLAEKIIQDIDGNIKRIAQSIAESSQGEVKKIWLELIRRYLGYGSRYLKYLKDGFD